MSEHPHDVAIEQNRRRHLIVIAFRIACGTAIVCGLVFDQPSRRDEATGGGDDRPSHRHPNYPPRPVKAVVVSDPIQRTIITRLKSECLGDAVDNVVIFALGKA